MALLASYHFAQGRAQKELGETVAAIREAGYPASARDLDAWYVEPPARLNAATFYTQAFNQMIGVAPSNPWFDSQSRSNILNPTNPIPLQAKIALANLVATNQATLVLIRDGGKIKSARYPVGFTQGHNTPLDHLPRHRVAVRLCNLTALHHVLEGRIDSAAESLADSLKLVNSLSQEPTVISHLTQVTGCLAACRAVENILARTNMPPAVSQTLRLALEETERSLHLDRALAGERSMSMDFFDDPVAFTGGAKPAMGQSVVASIYDMSGIKNKDFSAYLEFMDRCVTASKKPAAEIPAAFKKIDGEFAQVNTERQWSLVITRMLMPALFKIGARHVEARAHLRLARLALILNDASSGKAPEDFPSVVALVEDPFTGKPLRYLDTGDGYLLWSVGPDGIDQGGKAKMNGSSSDAYDIVFTLKKHGTP